MVVGVALALGSVLVAVAKVAGTLMLCCARMINSLAPRPSLFPCFLRGRLATAVPFVSVQEDDLFEESFDEWDTDDEEEEDRMYSRVRVELKRFRPIGESL